MRKKSISALMCAAVLMTTLFCPAAFAARQEGETLAMLGLETKKSYKKAGENNPLYTQRFGADPGVMEYNGRLYVYMTNDTVEYDAKGKVKENSYSLIRHISCISSDDLVNWTDHGLIPVAGPAGIAKWAQNSWAPCAAHKTIDGKEKFFLYFCNGGNGIGVLCADDPAGPWRDEVGRLLITRNTPNCRNVTWLFDPAVMVDDDGTGYLAFGGGVPEGKQASPGTGRIVRLGGDMISLDGDPVRLDAPWLFEDSGLNKINGVYIYSYCSNWQTRGNALRLTDGAIQYMTAEQPMGPYRYAGELFPNEGRFFGLYGNNHHSIACLNGEYYLFYHSRPVEKAMGITGNYRSPQVDRITVTEEGRLKSVIGTMKGVRQLQPLSPYDPVASSTMSDQAGVRVTTENGRVWTKGERGSWIKVSGVSFGDRARSIAVTAKSETGCTVYVVPETLDHQIAAQIVIPAGGETIVCTAPIAVSGETDVYFVWDGEASCLSWTVE